MATTRTYIKTVKGTTGTTVTFEDTQGSFKSVVARTCDASGSVAKPVPTGLAVTGPHKGQITYPPGTFHTEIIFCSDDATQLKALLPTLKPAGKGPVAPNVTWAWVGPGGPVSDEDPPPPPPADHAFDPADVFSL